MNGNRFLLQSKVPRKGAVIKKQINENADRFDIEWNFFSFWLICLTPMIYLVEVLRIL